MNALDQQRASAPPVIWTSAKVRDRVVEAFATEKKLPGQQHFAAVSSSWPATPIHEFSDIVNWHEGEARERVWQSWQNAKGAFPYEVSRMEQVFDWLRYLPEGERRCLMAWAAALVHGRPVKKVLRQHGGWTRRTFYRKRNLALARIAERLNQTGVQVR